MVINRNHSSHAESEGAAPPRPYPYPFKAMLAICSDLDETPDRHAYWSVMQFLNSRLTGPLGTGVGLEVGNSMYFDMPPEQFSYWNTDDQGRAMIRSLIQSGHIDCLHSFGDLATDRRHAGRALDELAKHDCGLGVWVDHAVAPSNFGSDIMRGFGDVRGHRAYHADLTRSYGIRYVWRGRVTSVIGQDRPGLLKGLWNVRHPAASLRTLAKEGAKRALAKTGKSRYGIHRSNRVVNPAHLRDGTPIIEFLRCNPHWGGVSRCDTADGIAEVLTTSFIDRIVQRRSCCVLYTHLGKRRRQNGDSALSAAARDCFRQLAERQSRGDVLVTTTRRLLDYCQTRRELRVAVSKREHRLCFDLSLPGPTRSLELLHGVTLYTDAPDTTEIRSNDSPLSDIVRNPVDETGRPSVSIRWPALDFPQP
jgi:hypothetical protein